MVTKSGVDLIVPSLVKELTHQRMKAQTLALDGRTRISPGLRADSSRFFCSICLPKEPVPGTSFCFDSFKFLLTYIHLCVTIHKYFG